MEQPRNRLLEFEEGTRKEAALQRELAAERGARRQALPEQERSAGEEVDAHKTTHFPSKPCCKYCQMGKGRQVRHPNYLPQDRGREGSLIQIECVFLKATGELAELQKEA